MSKLPKSKKVFDNSKVTDHHAIIPTNIKATNLTDREKTVYDLIAKRFIAAFYPDCQVSNTTVTGEVEKVGFKVTGRQVLSPGWRVVLGKESPTENTVVEELQILPAFKPGESGEHTGRKADTTAQAIYRSLFAACHGDGRENGRR